MNRLTRILASQELEQKLAKAEAAGYTLGRRNRHRSSEIYTGKEATRWLKGWRRGQAEYKKERGINW